MLICGIVNDLEKNPGINANFCYFFFQATDDRINTAAAAVKGLIYSFFEPRQNLLGKPLSDIRDKFEAKLSQLSGPNAWQILCDIFEAIIQHEALPNVVCVVDALDECEHGVKLLLSFIAKTSNQVKWLFSSRNIKEIELGLRSVDDSRRLVLEMTRNANCVSQSVDAYIDDTTRDIAALIDDEDLRIKSKGTLKLKAEGTFLWVSLVVEQLRDTDRRDIEEVLEELPAGLENLYDLIMKRITQKVKKKNQDVCHILLSIVTTAERPLRLEELLEFIKFQWTDYKKDYDVRDMKDIVRDCGSFLSIRDDIVYLVHQSVKDYMVGKGAKTIFPSGIQYQHSEMLKNSLYSMSSILTYDIYHIKAPGTKQINISRPYPDPLAPIAYCCVFWVRHLVHSCQLKRSSADELVRDGGTLHNFLRIKFLCWLEALVLMGQFSQGIIALNQVRSIIARSRNHKNSQYHAGEMIYAREEIRDNSLDNSFRAFIDGAWKFINSWESYVCQFPLQLYYAPFVFGDNNNIINKTFQEAIHTEFGELPTFRYIPPRRCSWMQVIRSYAGFFKILRYSPDSSLLCILHKNGGVSLWKTSSGTLEREIELNEEEEGAEFMSHPSKKHNIAFLPDFNRLISVRSDGLVQIWSIDDRMHTQRHRLKFTNILERVIALSENGDMAASAITGSNGQLTIWTTKTSSQLRVIRLDNMPSHVSGAFSPNSTLIALIYEAGITVYSVQTGKAIQHLQRPPKSLFSQSAGCKIQAKFSPNSEILAYIYDGCNIQLWSTNTWTAMQTLKDVTRHDKIDQFEFSPDSAGFIIRTRGNLFVGKAATGQYQRYILPPSSAIAADISSFSISRSWTDSSWLLATGDGRNVDVWLIDIADALSDTQAIDFHSGSTLHISPDSKLIAAMKDWNFGIKIIATDSGEIVRTIRRQKPSRSKLAFSPNSYLCAGQAADRDEVHIWDINTGTAIQKLKGLGYSRKVMAFSYDSKYLVIGDEDAGHYMNYPKCDVGIWHVKTGQDLYNFSYKPSDYGIVAVAVSTDSKFVAICDPGREMQIWEPHVGHCVYRIDQWGASNLRFSSDSKFIAAMDLIQEEVQIWEIATGACLFCIGSGDPLAFFDPASGDILTDQFIYKNSSWKSWLKLPRHGYSLKYTIDETWICLDGQETLPIPFGLKSSTKGRSILSTSSLMAFTSNAGQLIIIKFPDSPGLKLPERNLFDAHSTSHPCLDLGTASIVDDSDLTDEDPSPNAKRNKR